MEICYAYLLSLVDLISVISYVYLLCLWFQILYLLSFISYLLLLMFISYVSYMISFISYVYLVSFISYVYLKIMSSISYVFYLIMSFISCLSHVFYFLCVSLITVVVYGLLFFDHLYVIPKCLSLGLSWTSCLGHVPCSDDQQSLYLGLGLEFLVLTTILTCIQKLRDYFCLSLLM